MSAQNNLTQVNVAEGTLLAFECATADAGVVGRLHLNNPRALNALDLDGVRVMTQALAAWAERDDISAVFVTGEGARAFCAGGDVKSLQQAGPISDLGAPGQLHSDFFREEYVLNDMIDRFPKPYASLLDGVVMGGGVGIAIMGSHRIGTETMKFGMPETAIGFFPDVGGGYFLSRLGALGSYLALTSVPISPAIAASAGITTHHISSDDRDGFIQAVEQRGLEAACADFDQGARTDVRPLSASDEAKLAMIERDFSPRFETVEQVTASLATSSDEQSVKALQALRLRSPLALKVTLEQLTRSRAMSFRECLIQEFDMCQHFMAGGDFFEGVRAVLVDKDHTPVWNPSTLEEVAMEQVWAFFHPLDQHRLQFKSDV